MKKSHLKDIATSYLYQISEPSGCEFEGTHISEEDRQYIYSEIEKERQRIASKIKLKELLIIGTMFKLVAYVRCL